MEVGPQDPAASVDLSGGEVLVVPVKRGASRFVTGSAYELLVGDGRLGELRLSSAGKGGKGLNEAEAITGEGSWRLYRPIMKLRPRIDVTDLPGGTEVASYSSKVFGDGVIELAGSGTFLRPGNPRKHSRIETEAGKMVLELDPGGLPNAEGLVRIGDSGLSRRDIVLLTVITCFARLLYERVPDLGWVTPASRAGG